MQHDSNPTSAGLLRSAVEEPGTLSRAYEQFHNFSLGNQLLAMFQCQAKGLRPGPMATYPRWKELGRHVRKGEKALTLCMPFVTGLQVFGCKGVLLSGSCLLPSVRSRTGT